MTAISQITTQTVQLDPGARLVLDRPDIGWTVKSGAVDLFLAEVQDGEPASRRHFLFEVKAGGCVMPVLETFPSLQIILVATQSSALVSLNLETLGAVSELGDTVLRTAMARLGEGQSTLPQQVDRWITGLSSAVARIVDVPPDGASAVAPADVQDCAADGAVTVRSGVAWIAADVPLTYCDGTALNQRPGEAVVPLAPGTWARAQSAGRLTATDTGQAIAAPWWPDAIACFHRLAFNAIGRAMAENRADTERRVAARADSIERLTDRTIGSFRNVAETSRKAWQSGAREDERLLAVFMIVAEAIGLDLPQRTQESIAKANDVNKAVRLARLRQRQVALRGLWWREDLGPLIGFVDEERRIVALLPTGTNRWRMIDPVAGKTEIVDAALAGRIAATAHMLYPTLPDKPLTFRDMMKFGAPRSRRDMAIAVLAAIAGAALGLATPLAMRLAFDRFIPGHNAVQLFELAVGLTLAALITTLFRVAYDRAALRIDGRAAGGHPAALMDRLLRLPDGALRFGSADLALRFGSADLVRRTVSNVLLTSVPAIFLTLFNGALLFYYAHWAAAVAVGCFVVLGLLSALFARLQREAQRRGEELLSDVFNIVFQLVQAITVLRTTGSEVRAFAHWGIDFAELRARSHRARRLATIFEGLLSGIDLLSLAGIFLLLALAPTDNFSTGSFIAFVTAYAMFSANALQIVRNIGVVVGLDVSWERALPLLRAVPEGAAQRRDPGRLDGKVEVNNVAFRYAPDGPLALGGVSIAAAPGEFIALVGASGSGKSTLVRLLLGLNPPLQGTVQYDEQDLRHLDLELVRRQIGVVLQSGRLFPGTLFENIMGTFNGTMDDAWEAARQAGIEQDIRAMPMGMHTVVTEATAAFSGGQVQRLIIARALVGKPRILIFDEATSSLDNVSQAIIAQSLSRLAVTRIVIAHRLSTVRQADRIYVFDKGRIVQNGKYEELMKAPGPFAEFSRKQLI
jgi:NHLM bacteriocin system ABC transporter ATP-binding protein